MGLHSSQSERLVFGEKLSPKSFASFTEHELLMTWSGLPEKIGRVGGENGWMKIPAPFLAYPKEILDLVHMDRLSMIFQKVTEGVSIRLRRWSNRSNAGLI